MRATMMDTPLLVPSILRHAAEYHGETEVVSRDGAGAVQRGSYAETWRRCARLAHALRALGLEPGDRIGTLAWNGSRHLELYYAVPGAGMVCHTVNPRLFPEQVAYILDHAGDRALFVDPGLVPLVAGIAGKLRQLRAVVVMTDAAGMPEAPELPGLLCYEDLLAVQPNEYDWPALDERSAASMCYTSGTTGQPKGVLYSHRSTVLHAMAVVAPDVFALAAASVVMPVVPMFHVNAWGLPYAAPMVGAKLVLPGPKLDGASLHGLIEAERVTFTAGVPTVWMAMLDWAAAQGRDLGTLRRVGIGGSACPPVMVERFSALGVETMHAWGMTETGPVGLANSPRNGEAPRPPAEAALFAGKQGRPLYGMEFRVADDEGREVPRDGVAFGRMLVRGPWVAGGYHGLESSPAHADPGWFDTGDVVTMDGGGFVQIVDRTKDVIKSGGEWISSIDLENIAVSHPGVQEAAAVAQPDGRWGERPLLVVVPRPGAALDAEALRAWYDGKVARWCVPDAVVFVDALPHTATGKLLKSRIRELYCTPPAP